MNLITLARAAEELTPVAAIADANHFNAIGLIIALVIGFAIGWLACHVFALHPLWLGALKADAGKAGSAVDGGIHSLASHFVKKDAPSAHDLNAALDQQAREDLAARMALVKK